jgi:LacI family transcriptional regulator
MKDVAEQANVSVATVSRVINNDNSVSDYNRQAVLDAIDALNYELKTTPYGRRTNRIGLVLPDITNPYFPMLMQGITTVSRVHDTDLILCNADQDFEVEQYYFEELLRTKVDGIIYIPFFESLDPLVSDLIEDRFPLVFLDREVHLENICAVTSNNEEGAYQAVTYLLNLGHRDILFISGPPHFSTSIARRNGFQRGLKEFGLELQTDLILYGNTTQDSAYHEMRNFLKKRNAPITAVFASNDLMAFGAWQALEDEGYRIPEDVSIIGYDDIPSASLMSLTTIAQPGYEIGRNAFILLLDLINKRREPPYKIVLRDSLIIRKSCQRV